MEGGPAIYARVLFSLFGGALLVWTGTRLRRGEPVAERVNRVASAILARVAGTAASTLDVYCLTRL